MFPYGSPTLVPCAACTPRHCDLYALCLPVVLLLSLISSRFCRCRFWLQSRPGLETDKDVSNKLSNIQRDAALLSTAWRLGYHARDVSGKPVSVLFGLCPSSVIVIGMLKFHFSELASVSDLCFPAFFFVTENVVSFFIFFTCLLNLFADNLTPFPVHKPPVNPLCLWYLSRTGLKSFLLQGFQGYSTHTSIFSLPSVLNLEAFDQIPPSHCFARSAGKYIPNGIIDYPSTRGISEGMRIHHNYPRRMFYLPWNLPHNLSPS